MATEPKVATGASFLTTPVTEAHFLTAEKLQHDLLHGPARALRPVRTVTFRKPGA